MNANQVLNKNKSATADEKATCVKIYETIKDLPHFDEKHAQLILLGLAEFAVIFRKDKGIQAMWDYVVWCKANREERLILSGVMHDLNGRYDPHLSPRTSGYLGVNNEKKESIEDLVERVMGDPFTPDQEGES